MNAKAKGYILGSIAAASYGMNPLFALPLYKAGMDPDSVLFFQIPLRHPVAGHYDKGERAVIQDTAERNISAHHHGIARGPLLTDAFSEL
jgi:hypothetical protein